VLAGLSGKTQKSYRWVVGAFEKGADPLSSSVDSVAWKGLWGVLENPYLATGGALFT
jgi:hypothetical protein